MLYMQNMQNNMYKICNKYADKYAEYVHKYAKKSRICQICKIIFPICRICVEPRFAKHAVYAKYATNMQINMPNIYINYKYAK